ncbi:MAG: hypothetical protein E5X07_22685 [Mesorhizobium sp.]|uniref:hypothetical protein n=1 Tax=Mesorhizobium sp. TaxID=1871066 RepID=UPI0012106B04|nr:hypothetical protein [Mesorhizobium sp.]TIR28280.1 MAG: hypothetical protein E5X35_31335 [Mesorhizobium sp.]TIS21343.1 MAG: hypothetical protein E5X07_22685 [Mesorhizobium sp.]
MNALLVKTTLAFVLASAPVAANAGGFLGDIVNEFVPGAGTAMDDWNDEFKSRQSDESVWNQVDDYLSVDNDGFRSARPTPSKAPGYQTQAMGYYCWTYLGRSGQGAPMPLGSQCHVMVNGMMYVGQIGN